MQTLELLLFDGDGMEDNWCPKTLLTLEWWKKKLIRKPLIATEKSKALLNLRQGAGFWEETQKGKESSL